jgi:signal peptidase I
VQVLASILDSVKTIAIIIVVAFFVRFFLIQPYIVDGSSMEPNFHNGEYLLVDKVSYRLGDPQRGDVIVLHPPNNPGLNYLKRIIALPGDKVESKEGQISVNNVALNEPYLSAEDQALQTDKEPFSYTMKTDEYFVMGDNRGHSSDSREFGPLPRANIIGRTLIVLFPVKNFGIVHHPRYSAVHVPTSITLR